MKKKLEFINKSIDIILFFIIVTTIYIVKSSLLGILLYFALLILCLKNKKLPFAMVGVANYLPTIYGVSPIVISILIMIIIVLIESIFGNLKLKLVKLNKSDIFFAIMVIWSFITGIFNNDFNFFIAMITSIVFLIVTKIYYSNININSIDMLKYLMIGISSGIIFAFYIKLNLFGFKSYHVSRYAIGERADPNSTGLLFAILAMYAFLSCTYSIQKDTKKSILYIMLFALSLSCLFLTQSRGSVLCLAATILIYVIDGLLKIKVLKAKAILNIIAITILCIIIVLPAKPIVNILAKSFEAFEQRLQNAESSDGERGDLIKKSFESFFKNPLIGISLKKFENDAGHIPHNTFCDYMVTNGIVGIIFYIVFFAKPIIIEICKKNSYFNKIPFFCYLVGFFNILFYSASNEKIIILLLTILYLSEKEEKSLGEKNV